MPIIALNSMVYAITPLRTAIALLRVVLLGALVVFCPGCSQPTQQKSGGISHTQKDSNLRHNNCAIDTATALLKTGDVVLRMGLGTDSHLLSLLNQTDKSYSHCGIVIMERGYAYVYHSIGGEDNPDARLRRDPVAYFYSAARNSAIAIVRYDMDDSGINRLVNVVYNNYRIRPRFDLKFDLKTDEELYCSEFVYKALLRAARDTAYLPTSHLAAGDYVAIDNLFINKHARLIWHTQFK